jgi:hypothetical protein
MTNVKNVLTLLLAGGNSRFSMAKINQGHPHSLTFLTRFLYHDTFFVEINGMQQVYLFLLRSGGFKKS